MMDIVQKMYCSKCDNTIIKSLYTSKILVLEDYILVIYDAARLGDQLITLFTKIK